MIKVKESIKEKIKETKELLKNKFLDFYKYLNDNNVEEELDKRVEAFNEKLEKHINKSSPFDNDYRIYRKSYSDFKYNDTVEESVIEDINHYKNFDNDADVEFFNEKLREFRDKYNPYDKHFLTFQEKFIYLLQEFRDKYNPSAKPEESNKLKEALKKDLNELKEALEESAEEFAGKEALKKVLNEFKEALLKESAEESADMDKNKKVITEATESTEPETDKKAEDIEAIRVQKETDIKAIRQNVLYNWKRSLDKTYTNWALNEIDKFRQDFYKETQEFLENLKKIKELQEALGDDTGLLFDLSLKNILKRDLEYIRTLANFIKDTKSLKELCDMLGRFVKAEQSYRIETIFRKETFHTKVRDIDSKEEIVGITYSRDIDNILHQEKLLLSEGVLENLFGVKYLENRLLTFKKEGYTDFSYDETIEEKVEVVEEEKKGPIIICVDTSGSMSGLPETIAKAVTLYLATRAMKQKRNCYLINFSVQIYTTDLTYPKTFDDLVEFLRTSFNGGTDAIPALRHAVKTMNEDDYKKSDLLFISDFVFNDFTKEDYALVKSQKEKENKFYSLIIGTTPMVNLNESIFDYNWVYDSASSSIKDITGKMYGNILNN